MAANKTMMTRIESPMIRLEACLARTGESGGPGEGGRSVTGYEKKYGWIPASAEITE